MNYIKNLYNENIRFRICISFILFTILFGIIGYFIKEKVYDVYWTHVLFLDTFNLKTNWIVAQICIPKFSFFILFAIGLLLTWKVTLKCVLSKKYAKEDIIKSIKAITIIIILIIICAKIIFFLKDNNALHEILKNHIEMQSELLENMKQPGWDKKDIEMTKKALNATTTKLEVLEKILMPGYIIEVVGLVVIAQVCSIYAKRKTKKFFENF